VLGAKGEVLLLGIKMKRAWYMAAVARGPRGKQYT
jgi:hypothetical protein